jgi:uncharacterized protein YndB with AHSA1/START domain
VTTATSPAPASLSAPLTTQKLQFAIRATPEQVWQALTDGAITPAYYVGFRAEYDLTPGTGYRYTAGGGDVITGMVLAVEPGRRLQATFNGYWDPSVAALPESTVTFSIFDPFMPMPGVTFLSCVHEGLPDTEAAAHLEIGWVTILSGLKTLLETGAPMVDGPAH